MIRKILIANRGEIACRIARTCRRMGLAVAGVHSSADADALHVKEIGESIAIGEGPAADSYLRGDRIIAAAKTVGADAVHPGFGFLAENAVFAQAVESAGLIFVGPTPDVIERLGDKALAKAEAAAAGVPIVPGSAEPSEDAVQIAQAAREIGLPVLLKAAAGGGGKGMRVVTALDMLPDEIFSAMREAKSAFGRAALIVEKFIPHGRHIEVQIVGDGRGNVVHLFERECTLQRRHQKLVEEAPAANLPRPIRDRMLADAVRLGARLEYRGVGTVEFILGGETYYFLEVNPRLQVEHPVTEEITGFDIVELMIRIAAGEGLPFAQAGVRCTGHAVEARLCAEDPANNFLPSTGTLSLVTFPQGGVRIETGVETGSGISSFYDPMIAKLIVHAATRDAALDRLSAALGATAIGGVTTNAAFLQRLLALPETRDATFHTRLIDERLGDLAPDEAADSRGFAIAAAFWLLRQRGNARGPWHARIFTGWQMGDAGDGLSPIPILHLASAGTSAEIRFGPFRPDGSLLVGVDDARITLRLHEQGHGRFSVVTGDRHDSVHIHGDDATITVHDKMGTRAFAALPYLSYIGAHAERTGELRAPMMGMILEVKVAVGDAVKTGDIAAVLESMKMELRIASEVDGTVTAVHCRAGETVERNAVVVVVEPQR